MLAAYTFKDYRRAAGKKTEVGASTASSTSPQGQFTAITTETLFELFGVDWDNAQTARFRNRVDFSGDRFNLETLLGPEKGLMHPKFCREFIEILNLKGNQLVDVSILNARTQDGLFFEFRSLAVLNLSRNMIHDIQLVISTLLEINLSHNTLACLPKFEQIPNLRRLSVSHNLIDSDVSGLKENLKLAFLDISHNRLSWKPSVFKRQMDTMASLSLEEVRIWPNPFAEHFKEYQLVAALTLESLKILDNWPIDNDLRSELQKSRFDKASFDFFKFDAKAVQRAEVNEQIKEHEGFVDPSTIPMLSELIEVLDHALEKPLEVHLHLASFETKVANIWGASFWDRICLLKIRDDTGAEMRRMKPEEEANKVSEFIDRLHQILERYDNVRHTCIKCMVRLMASGSEELGAACARILAEWLDANTNELQPNLQSVSKMLLNDLCLRCMAGVQSLNEEPVELEDLNQTSAFDAENVDGLRRFGSLEDIAECASILKALTNFGCSKVYLPGPSPERSMMLRLFLPCLCRAKRDELGESKPRDKWGEYVDFDSFIDDSVEVVEVLRESLMTLQERCVRKGNSGFVVEDLTDEGRDMLRVYFKKQSPVALVGLRMKKPGRTLYVRPHGAPKKPRNPTLVSKFHGWDAWVNGLEVLVAATDDPGCAALAVTQHRAHVAVERHISGMDAGWLAVASGGLDAFTLLSRLAANLTSACGHAGLLAAYYFSSKNVHLTCWGRLRDFLLEGGQPKPPATLVNESVSSTSLIFSLVRLVSKIVSTLKEQVDTTVKDSVLQLRAGEVRGEYDRVCADFVRQVHVFSLVKEIAADTGVPDPVLLLASVEAIAMALEISTLAPDVLPEIAQRLNDGRRLLPYLKGPKHGDLNNAQYQDLWCLCQRKYPQKNAAKERTPELFDKTRGSDWRDLVPAQQFVVHPLMHKVMLCVVKLLTLINSDAIHDPAGTTRQMGTRLQDGGILEALINPATGLVLCQDIDVKIECVKCVHNLTVRTLPLPPEAMGWIMFHFAPVGVGVGKQDLFLRELIIVIKYLLREPGETGRNFRNRFGKDCIRKAFEILLLNSRRINMETRAEEEDKVQLSFGVCDLLTEASAPLSGGLRNFLRNQAFSDTVIEVMKSEDTHERRGIRRALLASWVGRDMTLLLPLVSGAMLSARGLSRYRILARSADVLQGRVDYKKGPSGLTFFQSTVEENMWIGSFRLSTEIESHDALEKDDHREQQEVFVSRDGINGLLEYADRVFTSDTYKHYFKHSSDVIKELQSAADDAVKNWWADPDAIKDNFAPNENFIDQKVAQVEESGAENFDMARLEVCISRLKTINKAVLERFQCNLSLFNEKNTEDPLAIRLIAKSISKYWDFKTKEKENLHLNYPEEWKELQTDPRYAPKLYSPELSKLVEKQEMVDGVVPLQYLRQRPRKEVGDLESRVKAFLDEAAEAHAILKSALISHDGLHAGQNQEDMKKARVWADARFDEMSTREERLLRVGLNEMLQKHDAQVLDPGIKQKETIMRKINYKYGGDLCRVRDASRLHITFPDFKMLLSFYRELFDWSKLRVLRAKNRYRRPTFLGRVFMLVNVEIATSTSKHVCEITMSTSIEGAYRSKLMRDLQKVLREDCQVPVTDNKLFLCAEYIMYRMDSNALRHQDSVYLSVNMSFLGVNKTAVCIQDHEQYTHLQLFEIERDAGRGVLCFGDSVRLRHQASGMVVDAATTNALYCRSDGSEGEGIGYSHFILEQANIQIDAEKTDSALGQLQGLFMGGSNADTIRRKNPGRKLGEKSGSKAKPKLEHESQVRIRSVRPGSVSHYIALGTHSHGTKVKMIPSPNIKKYNCLAVWTIHLQGGQSVTSTEAGESSEQKQISYYRKVCYHFAASMLPPRVSQEGGPLRQVLPAFRAVAQQISGSYGRAPGNPFLGFNTVTLPVLVVAAMLRCIFALINSPCTLESQQYAVDQMIGVVEEKNEALANTDTFFRIVTYALAASTVVGSVSNIVKGQSFDADPCSSYSDPREDGGGQANLTPLLESVQKEEGSDLMATLELSYACLPAKLLRLLTECLQKLPAGGGPLAAGYSSNRDANENHVQFMAFCSSFIEKAFCTPLLAKLEVSLQIKMDQNEMLLLRELACFVAAMVQGVSSSPLAKLEETVQSDDDDMTVSLGENKKEQQRGVTHYMEDGERLEVCHGVLPSPIMRVLVQAMLYGMHREVLAYQRQDAQGTTEWSTKSVKMISSLVNNAILAVSQAMALGGKVSDKSKILGHSLEHSVCEAISQAMSMGFQAVPRARIAELMSERAVERLRSVAQTLLMDPSKDGERVRTIGYAWVSSAKVSRNGDNSTKDVPKAARYLAIFTSHRRLCFLRHKSGSVGASSGAASAAAIGVVVMKSWESGKLALAGDLSNAFEVVSARDTAQVTKLVLSPRMRQMVGLYWEDEGNDEERLEILVFESSLRRSEFLIAIQNGPARPKKKGVVIRNGAGRGPIVVDLHEEVYVSLVETCKKEFSEPIVNVTFVRNPDVQETSDEDHVEVLIMSRGTLTFVTFRSFLLQFMRSNDYATRAVDEMVFDSDSDEDSLPALREETSASNATKMDFSRPSMGEAAQLSMLKGVWFMAECEPRARLSFSPASAQDLLFFCEADRQRWRRLLAEALGYADQAGTTEGAGVRSKGWTIIPSEQDSMVGVKKHIADAQKAKVALTTNPR